MRLFDLIFPKTRRDDSHGKSWMWRRWLEVPGTDGVYLERLTLFRCPWFQVMLQWLKEPDWAPDPHDHPWAFIGIVLRGGYDEERYSMDINRLYITGQVTRKLRRFSINTIDSSTPHRIARVLPRTMTLLLTGRKQKYWGFYQRKEERGPVNYVFWKEYVGRPKGSLK